MQKKYYWNLFICLLRASSILELNKLVKSCLNVQRENLKYGMNITWPVIFSNYHVDSWILFMLPLLVLFSSLNHINCFIFQKNSACVKICLYLSSCQFVVRANADYTPYLADPDLLVDWSFIEQIVSGYLIIIITNFQISKR